MFCKKDGIENFAKFTGKHLCQSLFLIKLQALGGCFCLKCDWPYNLQFSIFHASSFTEDFLFISFQQKNEIKKRKHPDGVQTFTFFSSTDLRDVKDFKRNLTDGNLIRKRVLKEM